MTTAARGLARILDVHPIIPNPLLDLSNNGEPPQSGANASQGTNSAESDTYDHRRATQTNVDTRVEDIELMISMTDEVVGDVNFVRGGITS